MSTENKRNWHAIEGPNGMCHCGVYDGKVEACGDLLEAEIRARIQAASPDLSRVRALEQKIRKAADEAGRASVQLSLEHKHQHARIGAELCDDRLEWADELAAALGPSEGKTE